MIERLTDLQFKNFRNVNEVLTQRHTEVGSWILFHESGIQKIKQLRNEKNEGGF